MSRLWPEALGLREIRFCVCFYWIFVCFLSLKNSRKTGIIREIKRAEMQSVEDKILRRIRGKPKGWVFTANDFWDFGSAESVRKALKNICDRGRIHRIARGLYHNPKTHPKLGTLAPTPEDIVEAIKTKNHTKTQPTGAYAANLLGLSTQVPGKVIFLTNGPDKQLTVGSRTIQLKNRSPRFMAGAGTITGLFIHALKYIGQKRFKDRHLEILKRSLDSKQKQRIQKDIKLAPAWIAAVIRKLNAELKNA